MTEFCDIQKLAELFNISKVNRNSDSEDDDREEEASGYVASTSTKITDEPKKPNPYSKIGSKERDEEIKECDDIEDVEKYLEKESGCTSDWRKCPKWDISYKQSVTASDVFLQMGGKNPSTASCEFMTLTIYLPGEEQHNIDLKVTKERLDMISPNYRLGIPLPHPVDPQLGNAKWDKENEKLIITLTMNREFDFINF